jgi:thiamine biosynthesis lipoprotein
VTTLASYGGRAMGSPLRLQVTSGSVSRAGLERIWASVVAEFGAAEGELSCFRPDSALSRLNQSAGQWIWATASPRVYRFLVLAAQATRKSRGRFDPRILDALAGLGHPGLASAPTRSVPEAGPGPRGSDERAWLATDGRTHRVKLESAVDSGGLGKGLALRWAWRGIQDALGEAGALLEAGGDIVGQGSGPDGSPWRIRIEDPDGSSTPLAVLSLLDGAVCTSSIARHQWLDPAGGLVHHLIDPETGRPGGSGLRAVTVAGPDPAWTEV